MFSTAFLFCRCEEGRTELFCLMCLGSWEKFDSVCRTICPNFPMAGLMISVKGLFPGCGVRADQWSARSTWRGLCPAFQEQADDKQFRGSWRRSCWHKWAFHMCYNLHWLLGLDLGLVVRWGRGISTLPYAFVLMVCFIDYFSIPQLHLAGFLSSIW